MLLQGSAVGPVNLLCRCCKLGTQFVAAITHSSLRILLLAPHSVLVTMEFILSLSENNENKSWHCYYILRMFPVLKMCQPLLRRIKEKEEEDAYFDNDC
jgi:hypothetical protein